ncbi:MAG: hypothetical protein Q9157_006447 [Trypethelium eluteriae]
MEGHVPFLPVSETQHRKLRFVCYTEKQLNDIRVAHREVKNWSDRAALIAIRCLRWSFDTITGYKHDSAVALAKKDHEKAVQKYAMTERKFMIRNIFLESIAGVPGMVGGMLRHLHSLRKMKRDNGWYVNSSRHCLSRHCKS